MIRVVVLTGFHALTSCCRGALRSFMHTVYTCDHMCINYLSDFSAHKSDFSHDDRHMLY